LPHHLAFIEEKQPKNFQQLGTFTCKSSSSLN
jgi:hypothetical protein